MGYLESFNWDAIKKDLQEGLEKSMAVVKQGAFEVQKKAGELTEEGKRQYNVLRIKARIHEAITDLGAKTYVLLSGARAKNPALDTGVKEIMARIQDLEAQVGILEGKSSEVRAKTRPRPRKKALKKK
ncbi:MAG TPA: hypothetical protein VL197_01990 [Nitrospirota bacterium]|nr:hypothetical protein [Nitrospirota bacterium]